MTEQAGTGGSLASITAQLRMAEVDLETRTMMMQEALQQLETARVEANRQVRYLSLGVNPVPPDERTFAVSVTADAHDPTALEQTLLGSYAIATRAGLHCARRVTELLTNAQQARLHITRAEWREPGRTIRIEGTISQYLHIPTLPQGFACTVPAGASQVEPEMLFNTPHEQPSTTAVGHAPPPHGP